MLVIENGQRMTAQIWQKTAQIWQKTAQWIRVKLIQLKQFLNLYIVV